MCRHEDSTQSHLCKFLSCPVGEKDHVREQRQAPLIVTD